MADVKKGILAVIPARHFDANIPGKNVLPISNTNLLVHKIRQLKKLFSAKDIYVSSEDQEYLRYAAEEEVTPHLRPIEYAAPTANFGDFVHYMATSLDCKHILWASPTSPLVDEKDFDLAIRIYFQVLSKGYDSLITTNKIKRFLLDDNGPLNFRFRIEERNAAELPVLHEFVNGIVIAPREKMIEWRYNWGYLPYKLQLPPHKIVDICNADEYRFACFLVSSVNNIGK